jgi:uncharacterized protein YegP (UPF0339 family)
MYFSNQFRMTCFCHHSKDWEAKFYKSKSTCLNRIAKFYKSKRNCLNRIAKFYKSKSNCLSRIAKFYKNLSFNNNYMIKLMPQRDILKTDQ